ncbi:MAG: hypothetical protein WBH47_01875 [Streptosporangiaceae bacterium]
MVSHPLVREISPAESVLTGPGPVEPATEQPAANESVATVEQRYDRAGLWVAIVVTLGWQVAGVGPVVVDGWLRYGLATSGAASWLVFVVLGVSAATVLRRGGGHGIALPLIMCPILLAGSIVGLLVAPGGVIGPFDWPFTVVGWFAVLALWRRRPTELLVFYAANMLAGGITLAAMGEANRLSVARFIALCCGISALQITVFVGSRMVTAMALRGARAADELARTRSANLVAEAVQSARRVRYETIAGTVDYLLDGLARGRLDLTDPSIRQQTAVAVTRLRRYLVESDEVPEPLWRELQVCTDAAERRGIEVDLVAPTGPIPPLPVSVRRALTEPIIAVLAGTATRARVTIVAASDEVVVAIMADAELDSAMPRLHDAVEPSYDSDGDLLWVQARWTEASASL